MPLLRLALASLANRRTTALLTLLAIALSMALLLAVERLRSEARSSFTNTISATDLVVGARSGPINLLLYSVFRIGNATSNVTWDSYQHFANHPKVSWAIPLSLGDSYRGYRVLGTTHGYFQHYRYGQRQSLQLAAGRIFADNPFEVVLGAEVAEALQHQLDDRLVLSHGIAPISLVQHDAYPFRVVGILARTGTPVDQTLHISLAGMEAIHLNWQQGPPSAGTEGNMPPPNELQPKQITAFLLGLNSRLATFALQREINGYSAEPLLAILPGVTLQELWQILGSVEQVLQLLSAGVVLVGLIGMLTALLASLNERRREMAILRSVGARPGHLGGLLLLESGLLAGTGVLLGWLLMQGGLLLAQGWLQARYGLFVSLSGPNHREWLLMGGVLVVALLLTLLPAWRAYRLSLVDGLSIRL